MGRAFEGFPHGLLVLDRNGDVSVANRAALDLLLFSDEGATRCCQLFECRAGEGPLAGVCLSKIVPAPGEGIVEIALELAGRSGERAWLTAAAMDPESIVVHVRRPASSRFTRTEAAAAPNLYISALGPPQLERAGEPIVGPWLEQRHGSRSFVVEGASALDQDADLLMANRLPVVTAADDQLALRRMGAALAAAGISPAIQAVGTDEAAAAASVKGSVVVFVGDVSDPARMAALRRLRKAARDALIVVVSPQTDTIGVRRALEAGADGLVFESEIEDSLAPSLAAVAAGQTAVPRRVRSGLHRPAFSHRERQVLGHVAAGLTNGEIADALFLSESTVKSHLSSAFAKLGVRSRKEAAALVLDPGQDLDVDLLATGVPALAGARTRGAP